MTNINIYVDYQNVPLSFESANLLLTFAQSKGKIKKNNLFYNAECTNQTKVKETFGSTFNCINVPCNLKNSADNQLKSDGLDDIHSNCCPGIVILISGDGDFKNLVKEWKFHGIKVIVIANKGNVKQELIENVDEFHYVDDLSNLVEKPTQKKSNSSQDQIMFDEGKIYLIETTKTIIEKGKETKLASIDQGMRQLFPNYQGVKSICKPDGTKFKKFKNFVKSVEKEGKVRTKNEQLFLV